MVGHKITSRPFCKAIHACVPLLIITLIITGQSALMLCSWEDKFRQNVMAVSYLLMTSVICCDGYLDRSHHYNLLRV